MFDPTQQLLPADLHGLTPAERDLVLAYQRVFAQIGQQLGQNKGKDAQLLRTAVAELFEQLHPNQQRLRITAAKLCSSVRGYGQYTEMASTFLAGRRHAVGLYVELENYKAEIEKDGSYAVRLVQEVVLYNEADGLAVWRLRPARTVDRSRNKRRDFFTLQKIHLPQNLSVGRYRLSITITDEVGQQADEAKIPLTLLADPKLLPESRQ